MRNSALYGGAIYADDVLVSLNLTNNLFQNNSAMIGGGAIWKRSTSKFVFKSLETRLRIWKFYVKIENSFFLRMNIFFKP